MLALDHHPETEAEDRITAGAGAEPRGNHELYGLTTVRNEGGSDLCAVGYYCVWDEKKRAFILRRQSTESGRTFSLLHEALIASPPKTGEPAFHAIFARNLTSSTATNPVQTIEDLASYVWDFRVQWPMHIPVPSGPGALILSEGAGNSAKGKPAPAPLAPGAFITLLVQEKDGKATVQVLDDAAADAGESGAELTVRNFAVDLTAFQVRSGEDFHARLSSPGGFLHLRGLERRAMMLETIATTSAGAEMKWSNEIDFRTHRKATLLIQTDAYGRVRPRIALDGVTSPERTARE